MKKLVLSLAVAACLASAPVGSAALLERFEDDCSVSVLIKRPFSNVLSPDTNDVVLGRDWLGNACSFIDPNGALQITGVCQEFQGQTTSFTQFYSYAGMRNADGYFRWVCGSTRERSRCPAGTTRVRFRLLGGDDEFQTECHNG